MGQNESGVCMCDSLREQSEKKFWMRRAGMCVCAIRNEANNVKCASNEKIKPAIADIEYEKPIIADGP
jgi:hypothetical protein